MAEYLIQEATLDAIADAINAKTGGSSAMTPAEMVTEIAAIPSGGGVTTQPLSVTANGTYTAPSGTAYTPVTVNVPTGGSLPSVITKIDGGSFTPSSDTRADQYSISHSLGVAPKGFVVWADGAITGSVATRHVINLYVADVDFAHSGTNYLGKAVANILYNGNASVVNVNLTSSTISNYLTASTIVYSNNVLYYRSGTTYKWLAWA